MTWRGATVAVGITMMIGLAGAFRLGAAGPDVEGAWRMERYEGGGNVGPATGQLMLVDGRFSLIYTMTGADGTLSGRAHGGGYRLDGTTLDLDVEWSLDHVNGKGGVAAKRSSRRPQIQVAGDQLTLRFENGAVQIFRRIAAR